MPQGAGYFWSGLAQGLQSGVNLYTQLEAIREKRKLRKEADELSQKLALETQKLANFIDEALQDGQLTPDEFDNYVVIFAGLSPEARELFKDIHKAIIEDRPEYVKQALELTKQRFEMLADMIKSGAPFEDVFRYVENNIPLKTKEGQFALQKIAERLAEKQKQQELVEQAGLPYEQRRVLGQAPTPEDEIRALQMLQEFTDNPAAFEQARKLLEQAGFEFVKDIRYEDMAKAQIGYKTAVEALRNAPDIAGFIKKPVFDRNKGVYYVEYELPDTSTSGGSRGLSPTEVRTNGEAVFKNLYESIGALDPAIATPEQNKEAYGRWLSVKNDYPPEVQQYVESLFKMRGIKSIESYTEDELKTAILGGATAEERWKALQEARRRGYITEEQYNDLIKNIKGYVR